MSKGRSGGSYRSAVSGRYVTAKHGAASPVRQFGKAPVREAVPARTTAARSRADTSPTRTGGSARAPPSRRADHAKRYVRATGKNTQGDITRLCNAGNYWSPRRKADAIVDIDAGIHEYWVNWANSPETRIKVVNGSTGKYLRTDRDTTSRNNLDDLPDC